MRTEEDFIGKIIIPHGALYGIHSSRARSNFPYHSEFSPEWYKTCGLVKKAAYVTIKKMRAALEEKDASLIQELRIPEHEVLDAMIHAADEVAGVLAFDADAVAYNVVADVESPDVHLDAVPHHVVDYVATAGSLVAVDADVEGFTHCRLPRRLSLSSGVFRRP